MQNRQQPFQSNVSGQNEYMVPQVNDAVMSVGHEEREQLARLLSMDFTLDEANRLLHQRTHIYENAEMQQRLVDDSRMHFARWLYEHGEMNEK